MNIQSCPQTPDAPKYKKNRKKKNAVSQRRAGKLLKVISQNETMLLNRILDNRHLSRGSGLRGLSRLSLGHIFRLSLQLILLMLKLLLLMLQFFQTGC